ncbi:hypothetical protein AX774_g4013 [Zancudomyces culisetae]|uniref:Uncharacterized protein n=1 Tax=Zancudomyces culisetae TaxID=1213189 RepID=A0A1R1PNG2_ZANCU|nr:hypothetical protein AX774_g4013 [Zancudomyces culisetae]|eukprot:OMH82505.1 hypothetical protein AX774_g4013 [Zancudomyces culisetae]
MGTESGESQAEILRKRRQQRILRSKEDRLKSIKQSFAIPDGDETGMHSPNPIDLEKVRNATSESVHQIEKEKNEEVKHKVEETKEVGESRSKSVDKIKKSDTRAAKLDKSTRNAESEQGNSIAESITGFCVIFLCTTVILLQL